MEILTTIETPKNFNNRNSDEFWKIEEYLMEHPKFLEIYHEHILEEDVFDYAFEDCDGLIKVIIW